MTTFSPDLKLGTPDLGDEGYADVLDANRAILESLAPLAALNVSPFEMPSGSLQVRVAPGRWRKSDGSTGSFAGAAALVLPASAVTAVWLAPDGTVASGLAYPAGAHVKLATVTTSATAVIGIADDRTVCGEGPLALQAAANDAAAAAAGVAVGCLYQDGTGVVRVRLS
jgi:hypothetical protein